MRIAIVSDVHANRQALEAVLEQIHESGCEEIWCLGDTVGYGGDPRDCIELIREHARVCLAGNHDLGVIGAIPIDHFSDTARAAAMWTRGQLDERSKQFLMQLQPLDEQHEVGLYHASPRDPVWEYVLSPLQAELCFDVAPRRVSLVGHSHVALEFHRPELQTATGETKHADSELEIASGQWLLNPGSVGQPRDSDPRAAWLELDTTGWKATYRRTEYDIDGAQWAIRAARLPESLATRLAHGQ